MTTLTTVTLADGTTALAINPTADQGAIGGPVVVPSCAQIRLHWTLESGKTGFNVLYGRYTGAFNGTVAQCNAILQALNNGAQWTALAAGLATTTSLAAVSMKDVNTPHNAYIQSTAGASPGTAAGGTLPNEVALAVTLRTAFAGGGFRGRIYVPGWATQALATGNTVAAAFVTALQNWANTIAGAFSAQGYTLVLGQQARAQYTGKTGTVHPARAATSTPITSLLVRDNHWDTQRRRGLK